MASKNGAATETEAKRLTCGIVMPISALDGCPEIHWTEVHKIISDAAIDAGFEPNLVSNADEVGIIQKTIIQNLYENPIAVCDVSGKNPNVMFELGMRLAFDKPTIIVKDSVTTYSFDTAPIEHLEYPRDLRFSRIVEFKQKLAEKIKATHEKATSDRNYTTFLKHFGAFTVAKLDTKEISGMEYLMEQMKEVRASLRKVELSSRGSQDSFPGNVFRFSVGYQPKEWIKDLANQLALSIGPRSSGLSLRGGVMTLTLEPECSPEMKEMAVNLVEAEVVKRTLDYRRAVSPG